MVITKQRFVTAFTLVETLITIGIAMVLAALIAAGTRNSLESAGRAKAFGNLRQIVAAMHQYATDNQDYFPTGYFYQGSSEKTFSSELLPYMDGRVNTMNPASNPFVSPTSVLKVRPNKEFIPSTYSVHGVLCGDTSLGDKRVRRSRVSRPSKVILIGEGAQSPNSTYAAASFRYPEEFKSVDSSKSLDALIPVGPDSDTSDGIGWLRYRTQKGAMVAMVDGHAELMPKGSVTYANVISER